MSLDIQHKIAIWERSIQTQMHFAELSIKMRQIGLTLAGGTIALAIVIYRSGAAYAIDIPLVDLKLPVGTILMFAAAFILYAAKIIDVDVYHRMLRGAVRFNELHERSLDEELEWKSGLTEAISAHSRLKKPELLDERNNAGRRWDSQTERGYAGDRIAKFYWLCITGLITAGFALFLVENAN